MLHKDLIGFDIDHDFVTNDKDIMTKAKAFASTGVRIDYSFTRGLLKYLNRLYHFVP